MSARLRRAAGEVPVLIVLVSLLSMLGLFAYSASAASYSDTQTLGIPPAANFAGGGGGDGWSVAL